GEIFGACVGPCGSMVKRTRWGKRGLTLWRIRVNERRITTNLGGCFMDSASSLRDLEAAEDAHRRVSGEIEAVTLDALAPMNVDVVSATSLVLGVADRILAYRDRLAAVAQSG